MLPSNWLERNCNFLMKAFTRLYISCAKRPLPCSFLLRAFINVVTSTAKARSVNQSASESSGMSLPFFELIHGPSYCSLLITIKLQISTISLLIEKERNNQPQQPLFSQGILALQSPSNTLINSPSENGLLFLAILWDITKLALTASSLVA